MKVMLTILLFGGVVATGHADASTGAVVTVIREYEQAVNSRDTTAFRRVLALDDDRFREIEDHIPTPFAGEVANDILQWVDNHPDSVYNVKYRNIEAFILSDDVAYAVAMHDWESPNGSGTGRTTFVLVRNEQGRWRIIHGHWSAVPAKIE